MVNKTASRQTGVRVAALCVGLVGALAGLEILSTHEMASTWGWRTKPQQQGART